MIYLSNFVKLVKLSNDLKLIKRKVRVNQDNRYENPAEHSWQLALLCLHLLQENDQLSHLDKETCLILAIVHDLLEAIIDDISILSSDEEYEKYKKLEEECLDKFNEDFPNLAGYIYDFNNLESMEARFVNAVDKLTPVICQVLDQGRSNREQECKPEYLDRILERMGSDDELEEEILPVKDFAKQLIEILKTMI